MSFHPAPASLQRGSTRAPWSGAPRFVGALAGVLLLGACSSANPITVRDPWIRLTDPSRPLAAFMTISNGSVEDDALVGAESSAFRSIELHETVPASSGPASMAPGHAMGSPQPAEAMTMHPVEAIPIPAGGAQALAPGGYHLMLMEPTRDVAVGDVVTLTLRFRSGRTVTIDVPVRAP